jgi:hypothetical protein
MDPIINWILCSIYVLVDHVIHYVSFTPVNLSNHFNGIRTKNRPVWITPGAAPLRWMGPNRNPQRSTSGMHEIFFLSDILFTSCYFTCTCLVLEISLFGSIAVNIVVKVFHIWHSDPYMDRLRPVNFYGIRTKNRRVLLHYVEWDRIVTLTGAQADWVSRYRIQCYHWYFNSS